MEFLKLETSPARRTFKANLGQANHFLITIEVGLDGIRKGQIDRSSPSWTSWKPKDPKRSADRSTGFASRAALSYLVDGLDAYVDDIESPPRLLRDRAVAKILSSQSDATKRFEELVKSCGLKEQVPWALANLGRAWRHRLLHRNSTAAPTKAVRNTLIENRGEIEAEYSGLDIEVAIKRLGEDEAPRFKETTAMIRGSQRLVEHIDSYLLQNLDLEKFAREAVDAYLRVDNDTFLDKRVDNIWSKDKDRRVRALRNVLANSGLSTQTHKSAGWTDATDSLKELIDETPASVKKRLRGDI